MPRRRIPTFTNHLERVCDEIGLPRFDETKYEPAQDMLLFLWHDPPFCIAAPLASASVHGLDGDALRGAWERKFGPGSIPEAEAA